MKTYLRNLNTNSSQIFVTMLACILGAILDRLFANVKDYYLLIVLIIIFFLVVFNYLWVYSRKIQFKDSIIRKQWEVYELLNELQKKRMKGYLIYGILTSLVVPTLFVFVLSYKKEELIGVIGNRWFLVPLCIFFSDLFIIGYFWQLYSFKIGYYDNSFAQILLKRLVELREQINDNNLGAINDILDEDGNIKYYNILLELRDGKLPNNLSIDRTREIINAEIIVIEQLEKIIDKEEYDIKKCLLDKVARKIRNIIQTDKKG